MFDYLCFNGDKNTWKESTEHLGSHIVSTPLNVTVDNVQIRFKTSCGLPWIVLILASSDRARRRHAAMPLVLPSGDHARRRHVAMPLMMPSGDHARRPRTAIPLVLPSSDHTRRSRAAIPLVLPSSDHAGERSASHVDGDECAVC